MDRIRSGFHRKSRKDPPARPTIITDTSALPVPSNRSSGTTTPEPGAQRSPLQLPPLSSKKTSPFRSLRDLSRSHKRARSPASGSEPANSPTTSGPTSAFGLAPRDSPMDKMVQLQQLQKQESRIPSFLTLSTQEIDARFQEIVQMENVRVARGKVNVSPDFRWALVAGPHLRKLDRYVNIQPWQNNRVRLRVPRGKQEYINASPVTLYPLTAGHPKSQRCSEDGASASNLNNTTVKPDQYIAMQGPKHKTTDHVWRMVVEQLESPAVMVMLTETHEAGMEKCYPYFPRSPNDAPLEVGRKNEFGDGFRASVRCETIEPTEAGDAIELRKLVIRVYKNKPRNETAVNSGLIASENKQVVETATTTASVDESGDVNMLSPAVKPAELEEGTAAAGNDSGSAKPEEEYEERIVWHFLYRKWPDFGVPALQDLDSFFTLMRLSRQKNASPSNPRIVHCSAGVGRSGTFIALEYLMRELEAGVLEDWDALQQPQQQAPQSSSGEDDHDEEDDDVYETREASQYDREDLIFNTVNRLREQRRHMVQAEAQYLFIYQVLRKLWEDRYGADKQGHAHPRSSNGEPAAKRFEIDPFVEQEG
ncbi:protein-tyrosine phosphatase-like protein [Coniella lustricola]|uniref:Protein-tyrosine phosphatase-like protein n=1 Tax=Coniella lustricola TaxID=2025994 RepID=A0A2T3ACD1_9PEZI|nr:protein-tyrosine phosphatase-like protein [Coniella lustricola]